MHDTESILDEYINNVKLKIENAQRLRLENNCDRHQFNLSEENDLLSSSQLDSSIKKNSAFVKKLKGPFHKEAICDEIDKLDSTKFISEISTSIIEAKWKLNDLGGVVEVCSKLHKKYPEFRNQILEQYSKYFPGAPLKKRNDTTLAIRSNVSHNLSASIKAAAGKQCCNTPNQTVDFNKIRIELKLFCDLISSGILPIKESFPILNNLLAFLCTTDKNYLKCGNTISTFCRYHGEEFLGVLAADMKKLFQDRENVFPNYGLLTETQQQSLYEHVANFYKPFSKFVVELFDELSQLIENNKRVISLKGELPKEDQDKTNLKSGDCQRAKTYLNYFVDLLSEEIPSSLNLNPLFNQSSDSEQCFENSSVSLTNKKTLGSIWDDDSARSFYEDLVDLAAKIPHVCKTAKDASTKSSKKDGLDSTNVNSSEENIGSDSPCMNLDESGDFSNSDESTGQADSLNNSNSPREDSSPNDENSVVKKTRLYRNPPESFYSKLFEYVNRDMIDNAAITFARDYNTRVGRKKLTKVLFKVPRTRLDLLPFFARLAATLHPYIPCIADDICTSLKHDFRKLFKKKDQINIESKIKNVRFIGEFVKFNLFPKREAANCLKILLSDFTHHHVEMCCNLLETCGRLLYQSEETHRAVSLLLDQMMRKKLLLTVDSKYITMIENAYYFTKPPEVVCNTPDEPPVFLHVKHLLEVVLSRKTVSNVLDELRMLDFNDKSLADFVIKSLTEAHKINFYSIRSLAALVSGLSKAHSWLSKAVVDRLVDDVVSMIETNEVCFYQRRVPMIRYFGELYNYKLTDSSLVFKVLYMLITYGVNYPEPGTQLPQIEISPIDPPINLFRIKLISDLLDTCGVYLSSGSEKQKLHCFLLFFQRYYWCKHFIYTSHPYCMSQSNNQFPPSIEYLYKDAVLSLRPKFELAMSYEEAVEMVGEFVDQMSLEVESDIG